MRGKGSCMALTCHLRGDVLQRAALILREEKGTLSPLGSSAGRRPSWLWTLSSSRWYHALEQFLFCSSFRQFAGIFLQSLSYFSWNLCRMMQNPHLWWYVSKHCQTGSMWTASDFCEVCFQNYLTYLNARFSFLMRSSFILLLEAD